MKLRLPHARILSLLVLLMVATATLAGAAVVSFQLTNEETPLDGSLVVLYFSDRAVSGVTDNEGMITFDLQNGRGFWMEVDEARLAQFYRVGNVPAVIDVAQVGTMQWPGR